MYISPEEVGAALLEKMKRTAEDFLGRSVKDAGKIAGLNVLRIINEPTAAAYGLDRKKSTARERVPGYIAVLATSGNTNLGGEDFTEKIVQYLRKEIERKFPLASLHQKALRRLTNACEKAKIELSSQNGTEAVIDLEGLLPGGQDFQSKITRARFENLCQELFQSTIETVNNVLKDAKIDTESIDEVILVGGSTRITGITE